MKCGYTVDQVRAVEAPAIERGEGEALMRLAARGLAGVLLAELRSHAGRVSGARVALLVGPGKNGGDGLFAAATLAARGAHVSLIRVTGSVHQPGWAAAVRAGCHPVSEDGNARALAAAVLVVDAILGTGGRTDLSPPIVAALEALAQVRPATVARRGQVRPAADADTGQGASGADVQNRAPGARVPTLPIVVAVDVPTGVDASTGECGVTSIRADHTVTFGAFKAGLLLPPGADAAGRLTLVDIGLDFAAQVPVVTQPEPSDLRKLLPQPAAHDHKYSRGVLGLVAGSPAYPGAAVLAATAAVSVGVGMLRLVADDAVAQRVLTAVPEAVVGAGRVQAWAVGPGAPAEADVRAALAAAAHLSLPVVVDAGGLDGIEGPLSAPALLTPHAGELQRLLERLDEGATPDRSAIEASPVPHARRAAELVGAVVLLKGHRTIIARPDGTLVAPPPGPAALATAGSGDTLVGIIGALVATGHGHDLAELAGLGVLLHSEAGSRVTHPSAMPTEVSSAVVALRDERRSDAVTQVPASEACGASMPALCEPTGQPGTPLRRASHTPAVDASHAPRLNEDVE